MFSFYDLFMFPLEKFGIRNARSKLIPKAKGNVLEIGSGTGVNLKHYNFDGIKELTMSDQILSKKIKKRSNGKFNLIELNVEDLPFEDNTFDFVIHTLVFCSVNNIEKGLSEIKRVLKPDGTLFFIEHILPEKHHLKKLFNFVNPAWTKFASGCNLNRDFIETVKQNDFEVIYSKKFMNTVFVYGEANLKTL